MTETQLRIHLGRLTPRERVELVKRLVICYLSGLDDLNVAQLRALVRFLEAAPRSASNVVSLAQYRRGRLSR